MTIGTHTAARFLCNLSSWQISNLALQKLLYLAHMVSLGRGFGPLVNGRFQAWDYGPVEPNLYHRVKIFGDDPIQDIFFNASAEPKEVDAQIITEINDTFGGKNPGELVAITHWDRGAWAKHYIPNQRGIIIPDEDIIDEYRERTK